MSLSIHLPLVQLAGYILEELVAIYKIRSIQAFGFWTLVNFVRESSSLSVIRESAPS